MSNDHRAEREDGHEIIDDPFPGHRTDGEDDHHGRADKAEEEGEFEALDQSGQFDEEGRVFDFLGRRAPRHVDFEEVAEERLGDVDGDPTEEGTEEEEPSEVFPD